MTPSFIPVVDVVDDDADVRRALARLIRASGQTVETFTCATELLATRVADRPGCLVADIFLPDMSGLDLLALLRSSGDTVPFVFITGHATVPLGVRAMKSGAVDFLTKPLDETDLLAAIERAIARDEAARRERLQLADLKQSLSHLTQRESEVFALVVQGWLNKQIAGELGTTEQTVKVHRSRVMRKMGASSLAQLVNFADRLARGALVS